jgi:hypothetical protein
MLLYNMHSHIDAFRCFVPIKQLFTRCKYIDTNTLDLPNHSEFLNILRNRVDEVVSISRDCQMCCTHRRHLEMMGVGWQVAGDKQEQKNKTQIC